MWRFGLGGDCFELIISPFHLVEDLCGIFGSCLFLFLEFVVVTCFIRANNKRRGEQVESACKLALPVCFFAFNCIYWTVLLLTKGSVPLQNYQNSFQQLV